VKAFLNEHRSIGHMNFRHL